MVKQEFKKVKKSCSSGLSKISPDMFKTHGNLLAGIYAEIYSRSFSEIIYPSPWKTALVTTVPKNSDEYNILSSFRPVAVTPIQSRVLDKLALAYFSKIFQAHEDPNQFAYKKGLDTTDALLWTIEFIYNYLDEHQGSLVKAFFVDNSSAFNTVLQGQLLEKISQLNMPIALWLSSYMNGWSQVVKAAGKKTSTPITVKVGIPQGGPMSAKIFTWITDEINSKNMDLNLKECDISKYSDDTRLLFCIKDDNENEVKKYISICQEMVKMSQEKNLKMNVSKCIELTFSIKNVSKNNANSLMIDGKSVPNPTKAKYLGLTISNDNKWCYHVNQVIQKMNFLTKNLALILIYVPENLKINAYYTYILPQIMYGVEVWGQSLDEASKKKFRKSIKYFSRVSQIEYQVLLSLCNNLYRKKMLTRWKKIEDSPDHPLFSKVQNLNQNAYSTRHKRKTIYCRTASYANTFIPKMADRICFNKDLVFL